MSVYDRYPKGDVYAVRQDTAVWMTPLMGHMIINKGHIPLRYLILMVDKGTKQEPPVRPGHRVTRVFDEHSNPSREEGLMSRIRPIHTGKSNRFAGAEVITITPGGTSRPHIHSDTEEHNYILVGEGNFVIDNEKTPAKSGDSQTYPMGVTRRIKNTEKYPLTYINFVTL